MPVIQIDGTEYEVEAGQNLLEACLSLGMDLPYFCWHPAMGSIGACRQCAVVQFQNPEDERGRLVMGCMTPVTEGAIFSVGCDKAKHFREAIVESLMLNHPHDCPVCAEGGECHLQDMTVMVGHRDRHYRGRKNTHRNQYLGPLIHHEMNRCITCYRCTRYYRDYAGGTDLAALASHDHVYFGRHAEGVLENEFAGNLVEVCPTGVFTDKSLVDQYTRKWDLQSAPSVCTSCAVGCNTMPGERYGKLKRVHNRFNNEVNGYFLCDRGRFGASFVNSNKRLDYPALRDESGRYNAVDEHAVMDKLTQACKLKRIAAIGSPRASVESNFLLQTLVGKDNYCPGFSDSEQALVNLALDLQKHSGVIIPDIKMIESADAILILGEDVTNTAPRLALALRQSVRNKAYELAAELKLLAWQDAAIRNLAQDQRSPLFIASCGDTPLDDVAEQCHHLAPADIARLGTAVAARLGGDGHAQDDTEGRIAEALLSAQRPLIVSGTGCMDEHVMQAAAQVAQALSEQGREPMLCLAVPEANSLGQAMLGGKHSPDLSTLEERCKSGEVDTLIVLENDLYRRGTPEHIDALLAGSAQVIVLDSLDNRTCSAGDIVLPAASFVEAEGTLVSLEGRAQRHFPVCPPSALRKASWSWILELMRHLEHPASEGLEHFDDITQACSSQITELAGITGAAPGRLFLNAGVKIPRQTHRSSGRTAMRANLSVHEPKQPVDEESPLAYTMEGLNRQQPGSLLPYVWSPGWNSNQSLHKFQSEVGGPLAGGTAGVRLIVSGTAGNNPAFDSPEKFAPTNGQFTLVPRYKIFGSEELSAHSASIAELVTPGFIEITEATAAALGVSEGDGVQINGAEPLEVRLNDTIPEGCAGLSMGHSGTSHLCAGAAVALQRAADWQRRQPQLIGSDGGGQHV